MIKAILDTKLSVLQLMVIGVVLGLPYVLVGLIWALGHTDALDGLGAIDKAASFGSQVVLWPVLIVADVKVS